MAIHNEVDTKSGSGKFINTKNIRDNKEGIKVRIFGEQYMGYSYFQKKDDGKIGQVRSKGYPEMVNPTDGYQGAVQTPAPNLYSVAWDYDQESPVILTLDKKTIINAVKEIDENPDLKSFCDYDLRISFDGNKTPAEYKVTRLDKTDLTKDQLKDLKEFAATIDLDALSDGGDAIKKTEAEKKAQAQYDEHESADDVDEMVKEAGKKL